MKDFATFKSKKLLDLCNSYSHHREIGWGSQKKVYFAQDSSNAAVALKAGSYNSTKELERIQREFDFLYKTKNIGIPEQKSFSYDPATREFLIIEEYILGKKLADCSMLFRDTNSSLILLSECCYILKPIWENKVVHRDLKPDNILIREKTHKPVIIDFGIARFLEYSSLTDSRSSSGPCTPIYAANEQLTNRKVAIDQRTDFFALGIIISELLYGHHPFSPDTVGNENSTIENICSGQYVLPIVQGEKNEKIRNLIMHLIQKEPFSRPRSSDFILDEIEKIKRIA